MAQTVVRSSNPLEALALAEATLGFRPRDSVVLVSLRPPRWRTGLVARLDLVGLDADAGVAELVRHIGDDGAGRCFVALFTDDGDVAWRRRPRRRLPVVPLPGPQRRSEVPAQRRGDRGGAGGAEHLVGLLELPAAERAERLCAALTAAGVEPEPWLVHRGRLYSYACERRQCCPVEGLPTSRMASTQVAAEAVLSGRVLHRDREAFEAALRARFAPAPPGESAAVVAELDRLAARAEGVDHAEGADPAGGDLDDELEATRLVLTPLATWRGLVTPSPAAGGPDVAGEEAVLTPETTAVLLDALLRRGVRDLMLGALVPEALPPCPACGATAVGDDPEDLAPDVEGLAPDVEGLDPDDVDPDDLDLCPLCTLCGPLGEQLFGPADPEAAVALLQQLARTAPRGHRAAALGSAAYLLWSTGAGAAARVHAEAALADDPTHSLSGLVLQGVDVGLPPPSVERGRAQAASARPRHTNGGRPRG